MRVTDIAFITWFENRPTCLRAYIFSRCYPVSCCHFFSLPKLPSVLSDPALCNFFCNSGAGSSPPAHLSCTCFPYAVQSAVSFRAGDSHELSHLCRRISVLPSPDRLCWDTPELCFHRSSQVPLLRHQGLSDYPATG